MTQNLHLSHTIWSYAILFMFFGVLMRALRYTAPRDRPGFTCGVQPDIDPERVPAELASQYLLHLLDNTNDPDKEYKTLVHNIAFQTRTKAIQRFPSPCTANCSSLFSLVLAPPAGPCYSGLFSDATLLGKDYYVVYIGKSLPEDVIDRYEVEAETLKSLFKSEMPKLCATESLMGDKVADSRIKSLTALFNFPFNGIPRSLADQDLRCMTLSETEQSLAFSGLFDHSAATFDAKNSTTEEESGFYTTTISRQDK